MAKKEKTPHLIRSAEKKFLNYFFLIRDIKSKMLAISKLRKPTNLNGLLIQKLNTRETIAII